MAYTATIVHDSIARARRIKAATLDEAKAAADAEFGDGFRDHSIVIINERGAVVARRVIVDSAWQEV